MSNYLFFQHETEGLNNRFNPQDSYAEEYPVNGLEDWQTLIAHLLELLSFETDQNTETALAIRNRTIAELWQIESNENFNVYELPELFGTRSTEELVATLLLVRLKRFYQPLPAGHCPRLFISHRQTDKGYALRMAQLAAQNNFSYWVDVLDPNLQSLQHTKIPQNLIPLVTACIIEMALINCTHVIACMTPDTRGSLWLPYEYGRITRLPGISRKAAAWLHPNLASKDFPEYMLLGECARTEHEIETWLVAEWQLIGKKYCKTSGGDLLHASGIEKLPVDSDEELEKRKKEYEDLLARGMALSEAITIPNYKIKFKKKDRPSQ